MLEIIQIIGATLFVCSTCASITLLMIRVDKLEAKNDKV
jgi:hypothetical protein